MWHAELGRSLPDMWTGGHHRGAQPPDLRASVLVWAHRYGQRAWLRQLDKPLTRAMDDAALRTIARLDGPPSRRPRGSPPAGCAGGRRSHHGEAAGRQTARPQGSKPRTARRSSPSPIRPWGCCRPGGSRIGTTQAGSGAATSWNWPPASSSAERLVIAATSMRSRGSLAPPSAELTAGSVPRRSEIPIAGEVPGPGRAGDWVGATCRGWRGRSRNGARTGTRTRRPAGLPGLEFRDHLATSRPLTCPASPLSPVASNKTSTRSSKA
jgi:hypothetical protein